MMPEETMIPDDEVHRICKIETDVAVLKEQGKAVAMALVLAKDLAAAQWTATVRLFISGVGWLLAVGTILAMLFGRK